jgi:hypothetical protein
MDTRFWGPSGWHLLHLIVAEPVKTPRATKEWFELLEYVLPCKYCRASFHDYLQLQPLTLDIVTDSLRFQRWLYDIHNRVNAKLRGQGLLTKPDPTWESVRDGHHTCKDAPFFGWDFMTSIAFNTPSASYVPVPMPDTPEEGVYSFAKRNRYNLLTRHERITVLRRWWHLIPSILPCSAWRRAWNHGQRMAGSPPLTSGRDSVLEWMWRIEESVCAGLKCPVPHTSLPALQRELSKFESKCGKKTCRTRRRRIRRQAL